MSRQSYRASFVLFLLGTGISWFGNTLASIAIPWYVLTTTGSAAKTGMAASVSGIAVVFASVFGGMIIDRLGPRKTVLLADLLSGLTLVCIPLLAFFGRLSFSLLLLLAFGGALLDPPGNAGRQAFLPSIAAPAGLSPERANAYYTSVLQGTNLVGAALAGLLIVKFGVASVLWFDVATFIIAIGLFLCIRFGKALEQSPQAHPERGQGRGAMTHFVGDIFAGIRFLWHEPVLRALVLTGTIQSLLTPVLLSVILPVYILQNYGGAGRLGFLLAAYTSGALASATIYGLVGHTIPRRTVIVALGLVATLALGLLIPTVPLGIALLALLLLGAEQGPISTIANAQIQRQTPPALVGRVISATFAFALIGNPIGTLLGGIAVERVGLRATLLIVLGCYATRSMIQRFNRSMRTLD
jgi:predicted MFS family arabinose efflux permease